MWISLVASVCVFGEYGIVSTTSWFWWVGCISRRELNRKTMPNPFSNISKLFATKETSVVGIDIGTSFVKVVQMHKKAGKVVLDTYGEMALGPLAGLEIGQAASLPVDKLVPAILDLFKEANVTSRDVVFSIPLTATMLSVIEMPDLGPEKLESMIPLEARKYIPTPMTEVTLNWWIIPHLERNYVDPDVEAKAAEEKKAGEEVSGDPSIGKVDVLIAAIHNQVIERYKVIAQKLGVTSAAFEVEIFSSIRATMAHDRSLTMVLDMGAANTKIAMIEDGIVRSSHLINTGAQDVTAAIARVKNCSLLKAEELKRDSGLQVDPQDPGVAEVVRIAVEHIFAEANRILVKYEKDKHVNVSKVVLTGGGALLKGLPELVKSSFETDMVFGDPFANIDAPAALIPILREAGPEFSVASGLVLKKL